MALNDEKKSLRQKLNDTEKELVVCRQKFGELNGQYDDLFQRYSQLVSSQIMNNNASIQDIDYHDPPRQVAETFHAELYKKQWGDAFDVLDKILTDERVKLEILRDFCRDSYLICVFVLCGQAENLRRALDPFSTKETSPAESNNSVSVLSNVLYILPGPVREEFIRTRRQFKNFKRILDNQCCKGNTAERVKKICGEEVVYRLRQYIYSSIEISWDMLLQTPPMVLDFSIEKGRAIDPEVMEHYSYPGPRVEFLVWPTVYRQCGGPVLSKAIVQTCRGDGKE
ncbi:uncharacterized protein [Argopecten irradians]|uniref:uncharacterized protein n=1 Tax=Argopecten irradians TaxID=31199 RepID=UPI003714D930